MKKTITILLVLVMVLSLATCGGGKVSDSVKNAIIAECDSFVEKAKQGDFSYSSFFELKDISYEINEISHSKLYKNRDNCYFVDITWYVDASSTSLKESVWTKDLFSSVEHVLTLADIKVDGTKIRIDHENKEYEDSIRIVVNGGTPYSGYDDYRGLVGNTGNSGSSTDSYGHDKFDAITVAEKIVKNNLKSPSTAKFCSTSEATISCSDNTWTVSGWVDAQNSFGATLRNNYTVKFTFTSSDRYTIDSCNIS